MTGWFLFVATFLACAVEAVEATTVIVAMGVTRGWRSSLRGMVTALVVLGVIVVLLGPAISSLPLGPLRAVVGALLLIFGLGWIRKAILRSSGLKDIHDEDQIFQRQVEKSKAEAKGGGSGLVGGDAYGFTLSFKATLLEGLEVAFIVVTFGANAKNVPFAALGALAAIIAVGAMAIAVRGPLSKVPENTIKFAVGIMLTSFGTFWGAEGAGAHWPGSDLSILGIIAITAVVSFVLIAILRRTSHRPSIVTGVAQ